MWVLSLGWEDPLEKKQQPMLAFWLDIPMDRGAWRATVHGVPKSRTRLSTHTQIRRNPVLKQMTV